MRKGFEKRAKRASRWMVPVLLLMLAVCLTACGKNESAAGAEQEREYAEPQESVSETVESEQGEDAAGADSEPAEPIPTACGVVYNGFAAAGDDGWIYYRGGEPNHYSLKKMRPDGSDVTVVMSGCNPWYINVEDGWVYYSESRGCIYKIRTDGTELTKLNESASEYITVADGWIYYSNRQTNTVNKMKTDGSQDTELVMGYHSIFYDGWIYYYGEGYATFRISADGDSVSKLLDNNPELAIDDEWIYFSGYSKKMRHDGSEVTETGESAGFIFAVMDEYIYYTSQDSLYRKKMGEAEAVEVVSGEVSTFSVVGDWIIYYDSIREGMYMIPRDSVNGEGAIPA